MTFSFRKLYDQIKETTNPHTNVIAMVSGGVDSMYLADVLNSTQTNPIIAHFQHCIRDTDYREAELVRMFAEERGLRFSYGRGENLKHVKNQEFEAREQRWGFVDGLINNLEGSTIVVTAHHYNDQIEHFLMSSTRGRGVGSLTMKKVLTFNNHIRYKPLLDIEKQIIYKQAKRRRIPWIEDPTNAENDHERNVFRNTIIPQLSEIRNIHKSMRRLIDELTDM